MTEITVLHYQTPSRRIPYRGWIDAMKDKEGQGAVLARVNRLAFGSFGDWKSVGDGVSELRIDYGPGYRVYFGRKGKTVVILLCGGDKSSQKTDIKTAKQYWKDYEKRTQDKKQT
jgi:putative addiction module killer protein